MRKMILATVLVIYIFPVNSLAQINSISVEKYLQTLPSRVYFWKYKELSEIEKYSHNLHRLDFKIFKFTLDNSTSYHRISPLNGYYIWIPGSTLPVEKLIMELPGSRNVNFTHNNKPFSNNKVEYFTVKQKVDALRSDVYHYQSNAEWIRNYRYNDFPNLVVTALAGFGAYKAYHLPASTTLEKIGVNSLGTILTFISVSVLIAEARNYFKYNRVLKHQDRILKRYSGLE